MSQDLASLSLPWSVKGVSAEARKIVKDHAAETGETIGHWLTRAIRGQAVEVLPGLSPRKTDRMEVKPVESLTPGTVSSASSPASGYPFPTSSAQDPAPVAAKPAVSPQNPPAASLFERLENRLFAISQRLDQVEQRMASVSGETRFSGQAGIANDLYTANRRLSS